MSWKERIMPALKEAWRTWRSDDVTPLAAAVTFYSLFSVAPLLLLVLTASSVLYGEEAGRGEVAAVLASFSSPRAAAAVEEMIGNASRSDDRGFAAAFAFAIMLIGASGVFRQLRSALDVIWKVPRSGRGWRGFLWERVVGAAGVVGAAAFIIATAAASSVLAYLGLWQPLSFLVTLLVVCALAAGIFRWLPNCHVSWPDALAGGIVTSLFFTLGQFALTTWLAWKDAGVAFGAAGALVIILIWIYFWTNALLFGAAFGRAWGVRAKC
jgi:membrane protein